MKKFYLTAAVVLVLGTSLITTSCIGSFALTNKVLNWNKQVGSKFVNELVFFAFWVLPVYEVTGLADLLVINSIEFWSGDNPVTASTKVIDTDNGRYLVDCDGKGYTVTYEATGESYRLEFSKDDNTWSLRTEEGIYPFMTMLDRNHVKMITPEGDFRAVELSSEGVLAYQQSVLSMPLASR